MIENEPDLIIWVMFYKSQGFWGLSLGQFWKFLKNQWRLANIKIKKVLPSFFFAKSIPDNQTASTDYTAWLWYSSEENFLMRQWDAKLYAKPQL